MKKTLLALCAAFGCLLPLAAQAQYNFNPNCAPCPAPCATQCAPVCDPWYLFAGVVHTGLFTDRHLVSSGATNINENHTNNWGWQIFLGYKFVPCFGLELGYVDLSKHRANEFNVAATNADNGGHYRTYVVPFRGNFSVNYCDLTLSALFGVHYYNVNGSLSNPTGTQTISRLKSGMDFNFGAAIEYKFVEWLGLRLDMSRYYIKSFDDRSNDYTDAVTANLVTYF